MNIPLTRLLLLLLFVAAPPLGADERKAAPTVNAAAAPKPKQFVYVLRVVSRLHDDSGTAAPIDIR